tara:strand:- start:19067 stop:19528 length:462 start_codon:yes stop_codon:yes gene_type:complete
MELTAKDVEILRLLQDGNEDSRQKLAERVGMSSTTLWRRINELEAAGVIRQRVALLDAEKIGLPVSVFVFVNLKNYHVETREAFETFVEESGQIMECYSVTGATDYILQLRCKSVRDFETFLMERILMHPGVESASSQISLRQHKYTTALPIG